MNTSAENMIDAVIFDMDGTLIEPLLDFAAIREELGIRPDEGILEGIDVMPVEQRVTAHTRLLEHELAAARKAQLIDGAVEVVSAVRRAGLKTALLTRNTRQAADIVLRRYPGLQFDLVRCREDGLIKPEPDGIFEACQVLEVSPSQTLCIGDFHFDIVAANAAGAISVLFAPSEPLPEWANEAEHVISHLMAWLPLIGVTI